MTKTIIPINSPEKEFERTIAMKWADDVFDKVKVLARYAPAHALIDKLHGGVNVSLKSMSHMYSPDPDALRLTLARIMNRLLSIENPFDLNMRIVKDKEHGFVIIPVNIETLVFMHGHDEVPKGGINNKKYYQTEDCLYFFTNEKDYKVVLTTV